MKRVIIESPYASDVERNTAYARRCLLDSLSRGEAPFASHLLYTQVLDDSDPDQRKDGLRAAKAWIAKADLVAVYRDHGITDGMREAVEMALCLGITVETRKLGGEE